MDRDDAPAPALCAPHADETAVQVGVAPIESQQLAALPDFVPRKPDADALDSADVAVSTWGEEVCPVTPGVRRVDWEPPDPKGCRSSRRDRSATRSNASSTSSTDELASRERRNRVVSYRVEVFTERARARHLGSAPDGHRSRAPLLR